LCGLYAVTFGGFVGLSSYLPIFFRDQYGLSLVEAGTLTACCGLGGSAIRPVGGYVADRVGAVPALRVLLPVVAVLLVLAGRVPSLVPMAVLCVVIVTLFGFGNGAVFTLVGDRFPRQIGGATGIIGAAGALGGFVLPVLFGLLTEVSGSSRAAFLAAAVLCGVAAVAVWQARPGRADELQRAGSFSH
jgi:NNP family nitrate/nitrite transporter-like MFS transporter